MNGDALAVASKAGANPNSREHGRAMAAALPSMRDADRARMFVGLR